MFKKIKDWALNKDKSTMQNNNEPLEDLMQEAQISENEPLNDAENANDGIVTDEVVELKQQLGELKEKYLRLFAEFDNFKKRNVKERLDLIKSASQDTMTVLLPILDDFDRAKKAADAADSTEKFPEGVNLVYTKLYNVLNAKGLTPMESTGEAFNPEFHEAITEIPAPTEELKGKIIDTLEKGYFLNDKIIRYAKVVVGK